MKITGRTPTMISLFKSLKRSEQARFIGELVLTGQYRLADNPLVEAWNRASPEEQKQFRDLVLGNRGDPQTRKLA